MKFQVVFIFAFLGFIAHSAPINISALGAGPIPENIIALIAQSQLQQSAVSSSVFDLVDIDKDGFLEYVAFKAIMKRLFSLVYEVEIGDKFIQDCFQFADMMPRDDKLSRTEFSFIFGINLAFAHNNIAFLRGDDTESVVRSINSIDNILAQRRTILPLLFGNISHDYITPEDFQSGLGLLSNRIGINLNFPESIVYDFISTFDRNEDGNLSELELTVLVTRLLTTVRELLTVVV